MPDPERDKKQPHDPDDEARFAAFLREVGDRIAARDAGKPMPPPEPWVDKPGTLIAAEKDVLRCQVIEKITLALCGGPEKCKLARCRRARRCAEIESFAPMAQAARETLARELAAWKPPPAAPEPPGRRRRR